MYKCANEDIGTTIQREIQLISKMVGKSDRFVSVNLLALLSMCCALWCDFKSSDLSFVIEFKLGLGSLLKVGYLEMEDCHFRVR